MKYLTNPSTDPHYNMAFDEYALEKLTAAEPVFFLWRNRPSVIIGLNQNAYAEVNLPYLQENGILLARRVTGGGAVYHDLQNLNYTVTGAIRDLEKDGEAYLRLVGDALRQLGVPVEVSGRNDLLVNGRKCSGYAKRISRNRLMIHGTLMFDVDVEALTNALSVPGSKLMAAGIASVRSRVGNLKEFLPGFSDVRQLQEALQEILSHGDGEIPVPEDARREIEQDAAWKFRSWEWIYGHSPAAGFRCIRKFPCGTVEASFSLRSGRISCLRFGGDFLGGLSPVSLEEALEGCRFTREDILSVLEQHPARLYFDRMDNDGILSLMELS